MHKLLVAKDSFDNYSAEVLVVDNDTVRVSPCLNPNFAVVTVRTEDTNAQLWANGRMLITGDMVSLWNSLIAAGTDPMAGMSRQIPTLAFSDISFNS